MTHVPTSEALAPRCCFCCRLGAIGGLDLAFLPRRLSLECRDSPSVQKQADVGIDPGSTAYPSAISPFHWRKSMKTDGFSSRYVTMSILL
jgi:hypothetical protein